MLEGWLGYHRTTLEMKCAGLSAAQLRAQPLPPSPLSLLGLVRHLADVERHWFRNIFGGERAPALFSTDEDPDADFNDLTGVTPEEVFRIWRDECVHASAVIRSASLDEIGKMKGTRTVEDFSMRWILTHMIEEYARHNGHADLIRETIDGATGT
ncbi:MAG: DinB family protein [Actinomycetota bacterium]|nr:DinB family protein [Actinomycetota bacterium]